MRFGSFLLLPTLFVALSAGVASCSPEGAVSLTGSLGNASITVQGGTLVTEVSGGFDVYLALGERASEATDVSFSAFSLVQAETGSPVLEQEHLSVVASGTMPIRMEPGGSRTVHFQIGDQSQPGASVEPMEVSKDDFSTICGAGPLQIVGTMQDSANGARPSSLTSASFTASCP